MLYTKIINLTDSEHIDEICNKAFQQQDKIMYFANLEKSTFLPSNLRYLYKTFRKNIFRNKNTFLELGSGDGRVAFMLSAMGFQATGIEYNNALVSIANDIIRPALLKDFSLVNNTSIIQGDFFSLDFSGYDILYFYDGGFADHTALEDKVISEMKDDALFVVNHPKERFRSLKQIYPTQIFKQFNEGSIVIYRK